MDTFKEEVYGKIQWECCRAKIYIVAMSLFYVLICATIITYAMEYGNILYVVAACVFCFSVWRINRLHTPVALVCEKKLLVSVPWSFLNSDFDFSFKSLYMPIEYSEITGVSNCWDHLYIGARVAGGIVGLPVQMSCVSRKDKKKFKFWINKKQEENRHVSRLTF